jgi:traB
MKKEKNNNGNSLIEKKLPTNKEQHYKSSFFKEADIPARMGKTIYLRAEYHERIQRILRIIGKDKVSLFSYVDNVLEEHFKNYENEIRKLYDRNSSIF